MVDEGSRKFDRYDFPGLIDQVQKGGEKPDVFAKSLDEQDLALAVHLSKYFDRRTVETLRTEIRAKKHSYDLEGGGLDVPKTPFALRNINDPVERQFVLGNIATFATVHGCTGGCDWCCFDAYLTKDLETVPLAQKEHFMDEFAGLAGNVPNAPAKLSQTALSELVLYSDNDPFDDPDLVSMMTYAHNKHGITPILSTVLPKRGEENFRYLTELAAKHKKLKDLRNFRVEFARVKSLAETRGFKSMKEIYEMLDKKKAYGIVKALLGVLENTKTLDADTRKVVTSANLERYNWALGIFGLGTVDDYLDKDVGDLSVKFGELKVDLDNNNEWIQILPLFKRVYEKVSAEFGAVDLKNLEFDKTAEDLKRLINGLQTELTGLPDVGTIRVSRASHRAKAIDELALDGRYHFKTSDRGTPLQAGKNFFNSGKQVNDYGISCLNGMQLSPFGLLNTATGNISHDFPQGRVMVPYRGLIKGNNLSKSGDDLSSFLENVVVVRTADFFDEAPGNIYVYDGDQRVRKIVYDHKTYKVVSDTVVRENVKSLADLKGLPKTWWGEALK